MGDGDALKGNEEALRVTERRLRCIKTLMGDGEALKYYCTFFLFVEKVFRNRTLELPTTIF